jgi:transcriptional regulator GlxA family with amidase domain
MAGCGPSRSAVERAWRVATGTTLLQSLHRLRGDRALRLIAAGNEDLHAVALRRLLRRRRSSATGVGGA